MADGLKIRNQGVVAAAPRLIISVFCLLFSVVCSADELPDPTRPPAMIFSPDGVAEPGMSQGMPGQGMPGQGMENRWSSGLQTIIISESRRAAIIDGQTVELGAKHGNAKLIEVNEGSVVLQGAQGRRVLTLFPNVKISSKAAPKKESEIKQPSSASKVQTSKHKARSSAHEEKK